MKTEELDKQEAKEKTGKKAKAAKDVKTEKNAKKPAAEKATKATKTASAAKTTKTSGTKKTVREEPEAQIEKTEPSETVEPTEEAVQAGTTEAAEQKGDDVQTDPPEDANPEKHKPVTRIKHLPSHIIETLNGVEIDFSGRSQARKALISMIKLKAPICILLAAVIAVSACWFLLSSGTVATTEMSLNYEESANGLNPNSTRFNVYDISSHEVVTGMLNYCGIDPESVDLNSVIDCISVRPTNAKSFSEDNFFISTSYIITMKKPSSIKGVSTKELLDFLCKAYKDNLYSKYTENRSILDFNIDKFNDVEFLEIADILDLKAQQIEKYLNTRVKQSKTFTEKESDETFKSLAQKVEDLRTYDIEKYRAFIIQAGCSHNKARYIRSLSYTNWIKGLDYSRDMEAYNVNNAGIKMYDESMISVVMIPTVDNSKNTYYMSKTKTGMDYMANQANDYLLTAQETAKEIATNNDIAVKMQSGKNTASDIKKANAMIKEIRSKFSGLSKQIEMVDKAYISYKTKDYVTFKNSNLSLMEKLRPGTLLIIVTALLIFIYAAIWFRFRFFSGGKKSEGISIVTLPFKR